MPEKTKPDFALPQRITLIDPILSRRQTSNSLASSLYYPVEKETTLGNVTVRDKFNLFLSHNMDKNECR
jgi:hypothetical protein